MVRPFDHERAFQLLWTSKSIAINLWESFPPKLWQLSNEGIDVEVCGMAAFHWHCHWPVNLIPKGSLSSVFIAHWWNNGSFIKLITYLSINIQWSTYFAIEYGWFAGVFNYQSKKNQARAIKVWLHCFCNFPNPDGYKLKQEISLLSTASLIS